MGLLWLLLLVLVIATAVYLTLQGVRRRRARRSSGPRDSGESLTDGELPRDAIDDRYADGQLSEDEYRRTRTDLD